MTIGILAVQGAFVEHETMLKNIGVKTFQIRNRVDLNKKMDGLVLPGGESTSMIKILNESKMFNPLRDLIKLNKTPTFATCAGLILLSQAITGETMKCLQTLPVEIKRNGFGRQLDSFVTYKTIKNIGNKIPMMFIRAPYINKINDPNVKILATVNNRIIAVQKDYQIGIAFHPELTNDLRMHKYFLKKISLLNK